MLHPLGLLHARGVLAAACMVIVAATAGAAPLIHLRSGSFDPLNVVASKKTDAPSDAQGRLHLVQLTTPSNAGLRQQLEAQGLTLLAYIPDQTYLVQANQESVAALAGVVPVRWSGPLAAEHRRDPALAARVRDSTAALLAILAPHADLAAFADQLRGLGCRVLGAQALYPHPRVYLYEQQASLEAIAALPDLLWLTQQLELTTHNDNQTWVVQSNVSDYRPLWDHGLNGAGQIIGQIDHGPDIFHCLLADPRGIPPGPDHRKVVFYNLHGAGSHGTHTAGTAMGQMADGSLDFAGVAYAARLAHDDFRRLSGTDTASPGLYQMLQGLHNAGARVYTNSWSTGANPYYGYYCVDVDTFCWNHETDLVFFAAGNSGVIADPSTSKNVVTCGATHAPPDHDDILFGGGGPTIDGRRKPDLFAVGRVTSGAFSHCVMSIMHGTSMATPGLAGGGALVRQYYMEGFHVAGRRDQSIGITPSAALLKATMINSSTDMTGVVGWPTDAEGWGRVQLDNTLYFEGQPGGLMVFDVWNAQGLDTGQHREHKFAVLSGTKRLRLTMAFTDAPGDYRAAQPAVNNLDLLLTTPAGGVYRGNVFADGQSAPGGTADPINNVEQIVLKHPQPGTYTARIQAAAVNWGRQGYALVLSGDVRAAPDSTPTPALPPNTPLPPTPTWTPLRSCGPLVSQGRPAVANGHYQHFTPDRAVDGVTDTGESRWISVGTSVHWLYVDLGQPYDLCEIRVFSGEAMTPYDPNNRMLNISKYTLHGTNSPSGDPSSWPILAQYHDRCGSPFPDYPGEGAHRSHLVNGTYRYVGIHITGGDGWCNDSRLHEFQVYADSGQPGPTLTPTPTRTPTITPTVTMTTAAGVLLTVQ